MTYLEVIGASSGTYLILTFLLHLIKTKYSHVLGLKIHISKEMFNKEVKVYEKCWHSLTNILEKIYDKSIPQKEHYDAVDEFVKGCFKESIFYPVEVYDAVDSIMIELIRQKDEDGYYSGDLLEKEIKVLESTIKKRINKLSII